MKGSIELARLICVEISGEPVPNDTDGDSYGSIEIAEILSAGYEKLKAENEALKAKIAGGTRVLTMKCTKTRDSYWVSELQKNSDLANATLLVDEKK